jgi:RNA-directed DNA polymerase
MGRAEHEGGRKLSSSREDRGKQKNLGKGPTGQTKEVKPLGAEQRAEVTPARGKEQASTELWEKIYERENLLAALKRVERNGGAPGIDGMPVEELRPYLKENWLEIRETLDQQTYRPSPVRLKEIEKPDGGVRRLGIPIVAAYCTSYRELGDFREIARGFH